jgi:glucose-6-phosphate dehydrogenase assembly protein OpcA
VSGERAAAVGDLEVFRGAAPIDLARVEQELRALWKQAADQVVEGGRPPVTKVSTVNLVVLAHSGEDAEEAARAAVELSARYPGRLIVVETGEGDDLITASISAHCHLGSGNRQVCSEQVNLTLRGSAANAVAQQIAPLLLPDLPRIVWVPRDPLTVPVTSDLLTLADRLIVDSHQFADAWAALDRIIAWSQVPSAAEIVDLAWIRLARWRALSAQLFDEPKARADLENLDRVEVDYLHGEEGAPEGRVEAVYYLAWLASRLGFHPAGDPVNEDGMVRSPAVDAAGRHLELVLRRRPRRGTAPGVLSRICLFARGGETRYEITRNEERNVAEIRLQVGRSCPLPSLVDLPSTGMPDLMDAALQQQDRVFRDALASAQEWRRAN